MTQRIGLFGGTFDPIHNGHLRLAETARQECCLEKILFLPSAHPPHKERGQLTPFLHRSEMLRLAIAGNKHFECSLIEEELPSPSYTIDTVHFFQCSMPPGTEIYFLIGIDAFLEICTWKGYDALLKIISFVVSEREGDRTQRKRELARKLRYRQEDHLWISIDAKKEILFLHKPPLVLSSSLIREKVKRVETITDAVPTQVVDYIYKHGLYRQNGGRGIHPE